MKEIFSSFLFLQVTFGASCNLSSYNTVTSEPFIDYTPVEIPYITSVDGGVSAIQVIDFSHDYNYWHAGTPGWGFQPWQPKYNSSENSLTLESYQGPPYWTGYKIFNGSIFPADDADKFMKFWSYYDHAEIWHTVSFRFRQNLNNSLRGENATIGYITSITPWLAVLDMDNLNRNVFPNDMSTGKRWENHIYGRYTRINHTGTWYRSSAMQLEIHPDDIARGFKYPNISALDTNVHIIFPSIEDSNNNQVGEWIDLNVTFRLIDKYTGAATTCDSCYPTLMTWVNGVTFDYFLNISYSYANLTLERRNYQFDDVLINDFYNELVEIPRMDSLEDALEDSKNQRIESECPHLWDDYYDIDVEEWHDSSTWDNYGGVIPDTSMVNFTLPENKTIIIRSCSLVATSSDPYQRVLYFLFLAFSVAFVFLF